jgi:hypothetical protein
MKIQKRPRPTQKTPLRSRYVGPLERQVGAILDRSDLQFFGRCLIKYIREEAKKDAAKTGQVPTSDEFYKSFSYQVKDNTIEVSSSWPWIDLVVFGTNGPYKMTWLTQQAHKEGGGKDAAKPNPKEAKAAPFKPRGTYKPPSIRQVVERKKAASVLKVPLRTRTGEIVIRTAPLTFDKAWVHPGIAKHNFINRAFERARKDCVSRFMEKNIGKILDGVL